MVENYSLKLMDSGYSILEKIEQKLTSQKYEDVLQMWEVFAGKATLECEACPYWRKTCRVSSTEEAKRIPALEQSLKTLKALQYGRITPREAIALLNQLYISLLGCSEEIIRIEGLELDDF